MAETNKEVTVEVDIRCNVLNAEQLARVAAIRFAREALLGVPARTPLAHTGTTGPRAGELVYLAEWILEAGCCARRDESTEVEDPFE